MEMKLEDYIFIVVCLWIVYIGILLVKKYKKDQAYFKKLKLENDEWEKSLREIPNEPIQDLHTRAYIHKLECKIHDLRVPLSESQKNIERSEWWEYIKKKKERNN